MLNSVLYGVLGLTFLLFGRQLYWLFVGIAGFSVGLHGATYFLLVETKWMIVTLGLVIGIFTAVFAFVAQKTAVVLAGFIGGGFFLTSILEMTGWAVGPFKIFLFVVGGLVGGVLLYALFDWSLIFITSLLGALFIVDHVEFIGKDNLVFFIVLSAAGAIFQGVSMRKARINKKITPPHKKKEGE